MNKKLNNIFKYKKNYKIILYFHILIVIIFSVYFFIPNFFNYSPKLIEESLKKNNDVNIKNILNINYKFFPSPRLRLLESTLEIEGNILKVEGAEIDLVFKPLNIINYKKLDYKNLVIRGGTTKIKAEKINQIFNYFKENKKKISFKKNNIFLLQNNKKLFEINDSEIQINSKSRNPQLSINGFLLNHNFSFLLKNETKNNSSITLKIPELDISANIIIESKDNFRTFAGLLNLEVLNNFFRFNFIKDKNIIIKKAFVRNNLVNSSFEGEVFFKPHFFFSLDVEPAVINVKKIFSIIQKKYFFKDAVESEIVKKLNGSLNFITKFDGNIIFENRQILFQNFKVGKNNSIFFNAIISDLGKKGKIQFNLSKNIQDKENLTKELKISGFIIPYTSNVTFEKILLGEKILKAEETKQYEKKFKNEVVDNSLSNILNKSKINNFFKNFIN
mgnify:CR=1 FL=1